MSVKGDWSRVKDMEAYRNNFDEIFRKEKLLEDVLGENIEESSEEEEE